MGIDRRTIEALMAFAQNSKLLSLLDRAGLQRLAAHGSVQVAGQGETVVRQGDVGTTFYLIASGEMSVRVREAGNKEVARLGPGMFFGEIAVVTRQPRSATVVAAEDSQLICFPREPLIGLIRDYPQLRGVLSSVGLARTEENMRHARRGDGGLAESLEGDGDDGLAALLEGEPEEPSVDVDVDVEVDAQRDADGDAGSDAQGDAGADPNAPAPGGTRTTD